jgi:hypothetical protein
MQGTILLNPIEERNRILDLKIGLGKAIQRTKEASYSSGVRINYKILDKIERLYQFVGLHWIFVTKEYLLEENILIEEKFYTDFNTGIFIDIYCKRPLYSCTVLPDDWGMEHIAVMLGIFPSISQARKNNWTGKPKRGLHKHGLGAAKIDTLTIL